MPIDLREDLDYSGCHVTGPFGDKIEKFRLRIVDADGRLSVKKFTNRFVAVCVAEGMVKRGAAYDPPEKRQESGPVRIQPPRSP